MNETETSQPGTISERRVRVGTRLLIYIAMWLLAALAFQLVLQPDGLTETDLSPIQQRVRWPLYTPIMAAVGLAQAFTWPDFPGSTAFWVAVACFAVHAAVALTRSHYIAFIALSLAQAFLFVIAVIFFFRHTQLPTAG
jgi:hypothetical protein